jgi:hypothetical protein
MTVGPKSGIEAGLDCAPAPDVVMQTAHTKTPNTLCD